MNKIDEENPDEIIVEESMVRRKVHTVTGRVIEESWYDSYGHLHCHRNAAYRKFDPQSGRVLHERWMESGLEHRWPTDGPTEIIWSLEHNRIIQECYRRSGRLHRDNNRPARIWYAAHNGMCVREEFWQNDQLHRDYGLPAVVVYSELRGDVIHREFYEHGCRVTSKYTQPEP